MITFALSDFPLNIPVGMILSTYGETSGTAGKRPDLEAGSVSVVSDSLLLDSQAANSAARSGYLQPLRTARTSKLEEVSGLAVSKTGESASCHLPLDLGKLVS